MKRAVILLLYFAFLFVPGYGNDRDPVVILNIQIKGKGQVIADPLPPYTKGQRVRLSFYPSGGWEFVSKPDVPLASEHDSLRGWIFDHWSYSDASWQEQSGLENPLTLTLQSDTTLYICFIEQGTNGHLSEKQYRQLMSARTGNFQGWQAISEEQRQGLFRKSEYYLSDFKNNNLKWGQPVTVWCKDFTRENPLGYDFLGEGTTWTGLVLLALALKHNEMPDDTVTIRDMTNVLESVSRNVTITGTPGRVARFSGPANDEAYRWYYEKAKVGAHQSANPWQDMIWLGKPTRDTHTGLFTGLSAIGYFCRDNQRIYESAKQITEQVTDRLIADHWWIKGLDDDRGTANKKDLQQLQMRTACFFNPDKYRHFKGRIDHFRLSPKKGKNLYDDNYWEEWLNWSRYFGIILLETDDFKRIRQIKKMNTLFERKRLHLNPFYTGVTAYLNSLVKDKIISSGTDRWLQAELEGLLLAYPNGIKWNREVDLFENPRFTTRNSTYVKEAALPNQVVNADFNGQRSAARAKGGNNHQAYQLTNFDLFLMYWLGKASGRLDPDGYKAPGKQE